MTFGELMTAIKDGGLVAALAVSLYVIRYLFEKRESDKAAADAKIQALNDRLIGMSEKQNDVLDRSTQNQHLLLQAVNRAQKSDDRTPPISGRIR